MLLEALPMLWACVSHPDVDVAFASSDAIGALLHTLKRQLQAEKDGGREGGGGGVAAVGGAGAAANGQGGGAGATLVPEGSRIFRAMDHLPQLLATLYQRMK